MLSSTQLVVTHHASVRYRERVNSAVDDDGAEKELRSHFLKAAVLPKSLRGPVERAWAGQAKVQRLSRKGEMLAARMPDGDYLIFLGQWLGKGVFRLHTVVKLNPFKEKTA